MNSQIADSKSSKPRFIFEEHNEFIKREPSIDDEHHPYPIIKTVKSEQNEATEYKNSQFPIETKFSVEIQAKVLQTFAPETAKVVKHYTIATNGDDGSSVVPDLIENQFPIDTKTVKFEIENFEPMIDNIDINTIKNEVNETNSSTLFARHDNLRCNHCEFETKDLPKLLRHINEWGHKTQIPIETVSKEKTVKKGFMACDHCEHQTKKKYNLIVHINTRHMSSEPVRKKRRARKLKYTCCFCDAQFATKLKKNEHIREHSKKSMVCDNHSSRCIHRRLQMNMTKKKLYVCNLCSHECCSPSGLSKHLKYSHSKVMIEFTCDTCGVSFQRKTQIIHHLKSGVCESSLTESTVNDTVFDFNVYLGKNKRKKNLLHRKTVCKPKYRCVECSFKCTQSISLKEHMQVHFMTKQHQKKSAKKYSCQFCKFKGMSEDDVNEHMMEEHKHEKPYFCKLCDCKYALMNDLVKHIKSHVLSRR